MEKRIFKLEVILAVLLSFIPLFLILVSNEVRPSISDYAYSTSAHYFVFLLSISGALFMYNGVVNRAKWYNIVLGLALMGVALTPHLDHPVMHYLFAGIFFLGSVSVMLFADVKSREHNIVYSIVVLVGLGVYFFTNKITLFTAEWIGIFPIAIHFLSQAFKRKK